MSCCQQAMLSVVGMNLTRSIYNFINLLRDEINMIFSFQWGDSLLYGVYPVYNHQNSVVNKGMVV